MIKLLRLDYVDVGHNTAGVLRSHISCRSPLCVTNKQLDINS